MFSWETAPFAASMHIYHEMKNKGNLRLTDNIVSSFCSLELLFFLTVIGIYRKHSLSTTLKLSDKRLRVGGMDIVKKRVTLCHTLCFSLRIQKGLKMLEAEARAPNHQDSSPVICIRPGGKFRLKTRIEESITIA